MTRRSTRSTTSISPQKQKVTAKTQESTRSKPQSKPEGDDDESGREEEEDKSLDSDALDDEEESPKTRKRKHIASSVKKTPKRKKPKKAPDSGEGGEDHDFELTEGQQVVGVIVKAPKEGRVPPGQISQNTFNFLSQLKDPKCNDREWFKLNEPVYRLAEKEWKDFVEEFTTLLTEVDPQVPPLPPKDLIHRIYRDIRFSNDKTPYKKGFSASFSRSGRKGIFAGYHIAIQPGGQSLIAAGSWCPGKNELATIRSHIIRSPARLRSVLAAPSFVSHFGQPKPHPKGQRQCIFGMEDELKVAPKGFAKDHKDIDLLKCRSFAVVYRFEDEKVLSPDFKDELAKVVKVVRPLVHCLNDMMTLPASDANADNGDGDEDADEGEGEGEGVEVGET